LPTYVPDDRRFQFTTTGWHGGKPGRKCALVAAFGLDTREIVAGEAEVAACMGTGTIDRCLNNGGLRDGGSAVHHGVETSTRAQRRRREVAWRISMAWARSHGSGGANVGLKGDTQFEVFGFFFGTLNQSSGYPRSGYRFDSFETDTGGC
jgi:hypothetical protein